MDKSAVMRDAHKRYRQGKRLNMGWSWSQCLSTAWAAARIRRQQVAAYHSADRRKLATRDFILLTAA